MLIAAAISTREKLAFVSPLAPSPFNVLEIEVIVELSILSIIPIATMVFMI